MERHDRKGGIGQEMRQDLGGRARVERRKWYWWGRKRVGEGLV